MRTAPFCVITQRVVVISYRRFGTKYRSPRTLEDGTRRLSRNIGKKIKDVSGTIGCPETSLRNYRYSLRNNPGLGRSHVLYRCYVVCHNTRKVVMMNFFTLEVPIVNTLRTGDADLRLYITTVQDGWRKSAFLTRAWFPRTIYLITQYMEHFSEWSCWQMFMRGLEL